MRVERKHAVHAHLSISTEPFNAAKYCRARDALFSELKNDCIIQEVKSMMSILANENT